MNANKHKNKQRINTHYDARKSKRCKHIENAPLFLEQQIFIFESEDSACPRGREVIVDAQFCPGYFIFVLGLGSIFDEFRIWASNLVRFYSIESLSRFCINYLFCVYFVSNRYLSCCVVSYRALFFIFIYVKCHFIFLIMFHN